MEPKPWQLKKWMYHQLNACEYILSKAGEVVDDQIRRLEVEQLILTNKLSQVRNRKMKRAEQQEEEEERKRNKRTPNHSIAVSPRPQLQEEELQQKANPSGESRPQ